jgi:hypothetical protein
MVKETLLLTQPQFSHKLIAILAPSKFFGLAGSSHFSVPDLRMKLKKLQKQ